MSVLSAFKEWIEDVTGYASDNVVLEFGGGPEPSGDHATFSDPDSDEERGEGFRIARTSDAGALSTTYYQPEMITLSVNIYAQDGRSKLRALSLSWNELGPRKVLKADGLGFVRVSTIRRLPPGIDDTGIEYRYQADFTFRHGSQNVDAGDEWYVGDLTGQLVNDLDEEQDVTVGFDFTP